MQNIKTTTLVQRDYFFITFIGVAFAIFSIPILKNLAIGKIPITITTAVTLVIFFTIFANIALYISGLIAKKIPVVLQIAKFAAVGAFNTFLDWGIVNLLMSATQVFSGPLFALFNGISFLAANSGSYFWNKYWTFASNGKKKAEGSFFQFFGITLIGLFVKVAISYGLVNYVSHPATMTPSRWANVGLALGTLLALVWNFIGYKLWVFKK